MTPSTDDRPEDGTETDRTGTEPRPSATTRPSRGEPADGSRSSPDPAEAAARAELLAEENRRLRAEYARARRATYRRTAWWLAAVGAVAVLGGLVFTDGREVLFALGGTGLFGAILTYYLAPGRFVAADVGERVYAASAANATALIDELGLRSERRYLPGDGSSTPRLFVPQHGDCDCPDDRAGPIVTDPGERGLLLEPTGGRLFESFERTLEGSLSADPSAAATRLADGLVEQFELATDAEPSVDAEDGRVTVAIESSAFGDVDRFDHPVASFLAVGLADALERPIELEVDPGDGRAEWLVTCRWEPA